MAPYALFSPRVIDFEAKQRGEEGGKRLWREEVDENVEFGAGGIVRFFLPLAFVVSFEQN